MNVPHAAPRRPPPDLTAALRPLRRAVHRALGAVGGVLPLDVLPGAAGWGLMAHAARWQAQAGVPKDALHTAKRATVELFSRATTVDRTGGRKVVAPTPCGGVGTPALRGHREPACSAVPSVWTCWATSRKAVKWRPDAPGRRGCSLKHRVARRRLSYIINI